MKAIFFDLDDTLYDSRPVYESGVRRAWDIIVKEEPSLAGPEFRAEYEKARDTVKRTVAGTTSVHSRLLYLKQLVETRFDRTRTELTLRMHEAYEKAWLELPCLDAHPALTELANKYSLGIITNQTCHTQLQKLRQLDPKGRLFRWLVTSEEVGVEKPSPVIFAAALRRAGCTASEAVMVGDDWANDIEGARAAGLKTVYLSTQPPPTGRTGSDQTSWAKSLDELPRML